jgi:hypothetical protein
MLATQITFFSRSHIDGVQTNLVVLKNFSKERRNKWYQILSQYFDKEMIGVSWDKEIRGVNLKPEQFYGL